MPIKNYTTTIPVQQTVAEISALLASKGARSIRADYAPNGEPSGVAFVLQIHNVSVEFALPVNVAGVERAMKKQKQRGRWTATMMARIEKQSKWIAWRIVKDWIAAQIAIVESNQVEAAQVFMPYAVAPGTNQTAWEQFKLNVSSHAKQLGAGD
jgi:hypothetical protein